MNDQHPHAGYAGDGTPFSEFPGFPGSPGFPAFSGSTGSASSTGTTPGPGTSDVTGTTGGYDTGALAAGDTIGGTGYGTFAGFTDCAVDGDTGTFPAGGYAYDPLYGAFPGTPAGNHGVHPQGQDYAPEQTGGYDTGQWSLSANGASSWDPSATGRTEYAEYTGQWDAGAWAEARQAVQEQVRDRAQDQDTSPGQGQRTAATTGQTGETGQWNTAAFDTGAYDATAWNYASPDTGTGGYAVPGQYASAPYAPGAEAGHDAHHEPPHEAPGGHDGYEPAAESTAAFEALTTTATFEALDLTEPDGEQPAGPEFEAGAGADAEQEPGDDAESAAFVPAATAVGARTARRSGAGGGRGRRRTPAKRSALLTVAVPSACVMGVAGIAAASVGGLAKSAPAEPTDDKVVTAADPAAVQSVAANSALDTQLAALSADARDFGDRASRTQERIDLKARQAAEKKKREEEAARREALRPKFALPVALHQLSARYGQAGVNWMSLHTGIDFPVQYGTPVMAATDGTVRTQWNSAYGNMAIVTAKDGTETWYCHLSSTKFRSGEVKAGEVIAYSGNSGNSTGPHLHFEVRPGGGSAIDPLPWLRSHGLDPTS
ncbi:M23 family metallopeptidase [Streptomyces pyxinae]|uniref:M23 family metallopeptidase n=1 Tax=Streptomyces pyxinae TaxID=2970734 RepID=UPI003D1704BB